MTENVGRIPIKNRVYEQLHGECGGRPITYVEYDVQLVQYRVHLFIQHPLKFFLLE